ncbi:nucleoside recognition protein [Tissierella sp. P1]|jgi:spore maturation protein A|uniref:nucleoside recognition domain-containing protein n=1 Tax=unclassified Tissierella TaxID=2638726 RepID=UPI000B9FB6CC|nr:nucleoside recognition domain-containing protein [Tissierella sp. P1]MDU5083340.1 nucleoside recognition domain-containing protein [Bacillota bacterium]OZV10609.1 nucleoside recognition protein [Tissierella sp. P1]
MINFIWAGLLIIGFVVGAATGNLEAVTNAAIDNAKTGVDLALGLIGIMTLWLGLMKIAEDSGLVEKLAKLLRPLMIRLFPDVPAEHPAMGAMIMNIAANMLGLGNAATPLGLKAMQELQKLSDDKETATDAMVTFLAINTSSVTLVPASTIAILAAAGATNPTEIIGPTLVATTVSTVVAIIASKTFQKLPKYQMKKANN